MAYTPRRHGSAGTNLEQDMRQVAEILADDGEFRVTVKAVLQNRKGREFSRGEQKQIKTTMQRRLAAAIRDLPYTDFGIENTKVK